MKFIRKIWWVPVLVVLAIGGYLYYRNGQVQQRNTSLANQRTVLLAKGSITSKVNATGSVRSNQSAVLAWTVAGQVGTVPVRLGDRVQRGQTLATLNLSNLPQNILDARQALVTDQQALDDLKASKVDLATAAQQMATAKTDLDNATRKRSYLNTTHGDAGSIAVAQASYDVALGDVNQIKSFLSKMKPDNPGFIGAELSLGDAEKTLQKAYFNLNYLKSMPTADEIATADAAIAVAQAQYDDAVRSYNRQKDGPTADQITAAQNKVIADQQLIDSTNMRAPFDGIITDVQAYPGETIAQGDTAVRIDDLSGIYVDLQVSEVDINKVQAGQSAEITFDAIPEQTYHGNVIEVGQIGTTSSGVVNYTVTIQMSDADQHVKTGMTAAANITTATLSNVLVAPSSAISLVGSQHTLSIVRGGQVIPVPVQTGAISDTETQIVSGNVKAGDAILANPRGTTSTSANRPGGNTGFFGGGNPGGGGGVRIRLGGD